MKIIKTIEIFNDLNVKLKIGDNVQIETIKGIYIGTIKSIKPNCLSLNLKDRSILLSYKNIIKLI